MIYTHIKVRKPLGQTRGSESSVYMGISTPSPESGAFVLVFFESFMENSHVSPG